MALAIGEIIDMTRSLQLEGCLNDRRSLYGRPSRSSIFRTFQGWLTMRWFYWRHHGTFERRILLTDDSIQWNHSNPRHSWCLPRGSALECIHTILGPFFSITVPFNSKNIYNTNNWNLKFGNLKPWYIIILQHTNDASILYRHTGFGDSAGKHNLSRLLDQIPCDAWSWRLENRWCTVRPFLWRHKPSVYILNDRKQLFYLESP